VSRGAPSAATTYVSNPAPPVTYQALIPQKSYQDAADYLKTTTDQLNQALTAMYDQAGTPAELGAQQAGIRSRTASAYAASLPVGDRYLAATTGVTDPYAALYQDAMAQAISGAEDWQKARRKAAVTPGPLMTYTPPSWANNPDSMWAVKMPTDSSSSTAPTA